MDYITVCPHNQSLAGKICRIWCDEALSVCVSLYRLFLAVFLFLCLSGFCPQFWHAKTQHLGSSSSCVSLHLTMLCWRGVCCFPCLRFCPAATRMAYQRQPFRTMCNTQRQKKSKIVFLCLFWSLSRRSFVYGALKKLTDGDFDSADQTSKIREM